MQRFYICPHVSVEIIRAKEDTHFTTQVITENLIHFKNLNSIEIENNMLPQDNQKLF